MEQEARDLPELADQIAAWCRIIEHAPVGMVLTVGERHTVQCVSSALAQLFNVALEDLYDRPLADAVALANAEAVTALLDRVFTTGAAAVSATLQHVHPQRGIVSFTCAVWRIGGNDTAPAGLVVQVQDVTSHVQTYAADEAIAVNLREINERLVLSGLREHAARAEAEAALAVRDQFLSIASHELKSPLTALTGYAHMLQQSLVSVEAEGFVQQAATMISKQADRLNILIDQLLDVSRIERGQLSIDPQPLDMRVLVTGATESVRLTLTKHTLTVTVPDAPVRVLGDELRLGQVVQNLLSNAVKYSPAGGAVVVMVGHNEADVIVEVTDTGIGIPAEAQPRLFDSFFRAGNANKHAAGFGVGLYVVKEIVTQHGGRIEVESTEGQGSTFRVVLPLHKEAE